MCKLSFLLRYKDSKNNLLLPDKKSIHPHKYLNLTILLLLSNQYCTKAPISFSSLLVWGYPPQTPTNFFSL